MTAKKHRATAAQLAKAARLVELSDLQWILSDRRGRRVLYNLMDYCNVFKPIFTGNSETFLKEGHRQVGLKLWADLSEAATPEVFVLMLNERKQDDVVRNQYAADTDNHADAATDSGDDDES